eukprot:218591-Amphidinium_carterae.1
MLSGLYLVPSFGSIRDPPGHHSVRESIGPWSLIVPALCYWNVLFCTMPTVGFIWEEGLRQMKEWYEYHQTL